MREMVRGTPCECKCEKVTRDTVWGGGHGGPSEGVTEDFWGREPLLKIYDEINQGEHHDAHTHEEQFEFFLSFFLSWVANTQLKSGPEPLEIETNGILCSKREDWSPDFGLFVWIWYKIPVQFVFRTCFASAISVRPRGTCKSPHRSAADSRGLRVRHFWLPTSDRLQTWLIPFGTNRSRQYYELTMVWRNLPLYYLFKWLFPLCHTLLVEKTRHSTRSSGTGASCVRRECLNLVILDQNVIQIARNMEFTKALDLFGI